MPERRDRDHDIQALFESAPNGVATVAPDGTIGLTNTQLATMFGYAAGDLAGQPAGILVSQSERPELDGLRQEIASGATQRLRRDLTGIRNDGSTFPVEIALTPFKGGRDGTLLMVVVDTTARKQAEARQDLLIGELHHRTQNIFAVIQSVATRTLSGERSLDEARHVFLNRLHALSRTYTVLTEGAWEGARLDTILTDELAGFSGRYELDGTAVMVQPSAAQTLAMIFHELATNAIKYGALSVPSGRLSVHWSVAASADGPEFLFVWSEQGGPRVRMPKRKGYGRTILEDAARHLGEPSIAYGANGLRYELKAPLASIGWDGESREIPARTALGQMPQ